MNQLSAFQASRFHWWLFAAVVVLVLGQALMSGHIHADTLDSADCYVCKLEEGQGKNLSHSAPAHLVQPQRYTYTPAPPMAPTPRRCSAAAIRAPPAGFQL